VHVTNNTRIGLLWFLSCIQAGVDEAVIDQMIQSSILSNFSDSHQLQGPPSFSSYAWNLQYHHNTVVVKECLLTLAP